MTQLTMLMKHFDSTNTISNMEAQTIYRIRALPRRISDLEERGWVFEREWRKDPTGQRYRRYFLVSKPEPEE